MKTVAVLGDTLVGGNVFGIQRFAYEILRELDAINPSDLKINVIVPTTANIQISFANIEIVKYGQTKNSFFWRQFFFPRYVKKNGCIGMDLTLGLPFWHCDIVCLHDCTYEKYKENFVTLKEKFRRFSYLIRAKRLTKKAKKLLTVSNYSKQDLMNYYHLTSNKIDVIYNAWQHYNRFDTDKKILSELELKKKEYWFTLGSGLKHKNLIWIMKAAMQNPNEIFVITGSDQFSGYLNKIGITKLQNVIYTGYLSDSQVKTLMEFCKGFIYPSLYEGFGIPPLEALACGANIIISNASCLPEIYENSAVYIDPYDYEIDMKKFTIFPEQQAREKILSKYSWEKSANQLLQIIREIEEVL